MHGPLNVKFCCGPQFKLSMKSHSLLILHVNEFICKGCYYS